jgi:hypothetical protein
MIIIGNKKDLWEKRKVMKKDVEEYLKEYPNDMHFEVDSKHMGN